MEAGPFCLGTKSTRSVLAAAKHATVTARYFELTTVICIVFGAANDRYGLGLKFLMVSGEVIHPNLSAPGARCGWGGLERRDQAC